MYKGSELENFIILTEAIEYIEQNLTEPLKKKILLSTVMSRFSSLKIVQLCAAHKSYKIYMKAHMIQEAQSSYVLRIQITDIV